MPRNSSGVYSLPAGNPVVPGTLIETTWANPTMSDIGAALTGSLPRDGSAGMQGPLILAFDGTRPSEAVTVRQLDSAVGGSANYMPAGAVQFFAANSVPTGWLRADGSSVSRTTYANLFAAIGTTYGAGNGTTTFNLPDLRGQFLRGFDDGRGTDPARVFGSTQAAANQAHNHAVTFTDPGHGHPVTDPGHTHQFYWSAITGPSVAPQAPQVGAIASSAPTSSNTTGISIANSTTGASVSSVSEGTEARPVNVAMIACIRAFGALQTDGLGSMAFQNKENVDITGGKGAFTTLTCTTSPVAATDVVRLQDIGNTINVIHSSDTQVLTVDPSTPNAPILRPITNVPFGMLKLNANGQVAPSQLSLSDIDYQGPWNASTGQNPSQAFPATNFPDGAMYMIDVAGNLDVYNSTGTLASRFCAIGSEIIYLIGSATFSSPGWYLNPAPTITGADATQVSFAPYGDITAINVQLAIEQVDTLKAPLASPTFTGTVGGITNAMVGLGNVANLAPADLPISTATQTALDGKQVAGSYQAADPQLSSLIRQNQQVAGYTCVSTDSGKQIFMTTVGLFLIPANSTVPFAVGTAITFVNSTVSSCTIDVVPSDVLHLAGGALVGVRTLASFGIATTLKVGSNVWIISGAGLS